MKNIRIYDAEKYQKAPYEKVEEHIYKTTRPSKSYKRIKDEEAINALNSITDWEEDSTFGYSTTYNGIKYYINPIDYEGGIKDRYWLPNPDEEIYVTSLMFEQEPEYGEDEPSSSKISQYPLEDILDKFLVYVSDFYKQINQEDPINSYQEFASQKLSDIQKLLTIVGKHVYNKEEGERIKLIIE